MKSENEPIAEDEWLLRIVHGQYWKTDQIPIMSLKAFEPREGRHPDLDGISLYREACLGSAEDCLSGIDEDKRRLNAIVRISAGLIRSVGLRIVPITAAIPGHVVIPEINVIDYKRDKAHFTPRLKMLAIAASGNVVRMPG